jgi:hypothetical protein
LIEKMRLQRPVEIEAEKWEAAVSWTRTAYLNIYFSVDSESSQDLHDFLHDVNGRLSSINVRDSVYWIWKRLAKASPYGKQYVSKFEPQLQSTLR